MRGIAVDRGRGIVVDGVSAGAVTGIVLSPMLHEHLSALLSGRRPPRTVTVLTIRMNAEVCSGHQVTSNLEIGQSWIAGRSRETTQHDVLDGIIRHQMMDCAFIFDTHSLLDQSSLLESV